MKKVTIPTDGERKFEGLPFTKNGLPRTRPGVGGHTLVRLPFTKPSKKGGK